MRRLSTFASLLLCALLAGCDMLGMLGIESASTIAARHEAEGKAIGGACRHAGRAIEDCYTLNRKADKGAVFAGWREMNDYMLENKIEIVVPTLSPTGAPAPVVATAEDEEDPGAAEPAKAAKPAKSKSH